LWEELAFAGHWFAGVLDPRAWLEIATTGGSAVLGLDRRMGRLSVDLEASFQVVSCPDGATAATLEEALCAGGRAIAVRALFLGGENVLLPR
jgi:cytosine/adenosine deaminase-related metal-dependent hydrolase